MGKVETTYVGNRATSKRIGEDLTDSDMADSAAKEKFTDTTPLVKAAKEAAERRKKPPVVTEPEKMSPLVRAAALAAERRKKNRITTDDAAAALGSRR